MTEREEAVVYRAGDDHPLVDSAQLLAVRAWLRANNIDPRDVPTSTDLTVVTEPDGKRTIHYHRFVLTPDGHRQISPTQANEVWTEKVTSPCLVVMLFGRPYRWEPGPDDSLILRPAPEAA